MKIILIIVGVILGGIFVANKAADESAVWLDESARFGGRDGEGI